MSVVPRRRAWACTFAVVKLGDRLPNPCRSLGGNLAWTAVHDVADHRCADSGVTGDVGAGHSSIPCRGLVVGHRFRLWVPVCPVVGCEEDSRSEGLRQAS